MPNGHDRDWIRFCGAIDGFRARYGRWPARVAMGPGFKTVLRELVGADGLRTVEEKVRLVMQRDVLFVAEGDDGSRYDYAREGFTKKKPDITAEQWLGVSSLPEDYDLLSSESTRKDDQMNRSEIAKKAWATRRARAAGKKAALTRKRTTAGKKAAATRKRRTAAKKAAATKKGRATKQTPE